MENPKFRNVVKIIGFAWEINNKLNLLFHRARAEMESRVLKIILRLL
ncbi:hypothetical protein [Methanosarcina sp.]|nr:hypothetical protein [Methanosarcina sp.]MDW5549004.1 hypothetical protein [Methanosarcina sp.]MDW5552707.1 hypothetical protein [Methanosarcina sp.]MDW5559264.1 hypothetical protein [Methanosarcina sp.]